MTSAVGARRRGGALGGVGDHAHVAVQARVPAGGHVGLEDHARVQAERGEDAGGRQGGRREERPVTQAPSPMSPSSARQRTSAWWS